MIELVLKKIVLGQNVSSDENHQNYGNRNDSDKYSRAAGQEEMYRISPQKIGELL